LLTKFEMQTVEFLELLTLLPSEAFWRWRVTTSLDLKLFLRKYISFNHLFDAGDFVLYLSHISFWAFSGKLSRASDPQWKV
jgi:hypothetical protein